MHTTDELNLDYREFEMYEESPKLIEANGRKYIFRRPPDDIRPIFTPTPIMSVLSETNRHKDQIRGVIQGLDLEESRILYMMGCLNLYTYLIAKGWEAIQTTNHPEDFKYQINYDRLQEMVAIADLGELESAFPSTYVVTYLNKYWGFSPVRRTYWGTLEFFRNYLSLFDFERGIYQTRKLTHYKQINYRRLLLTYEVLEEELHSREKHDLLPKHLGTNVVHLYNAVFLGYRKYRRNWRPDLGAPIHEESLQRPIYKDIQKPKVRTVGNKSWSDITGKVWDSTTQSWVVVFNTKDERDAHLAKQHQNINDASKRQ